MSDNWPLVELLLCAADMALAGYTAPITEATDRLGIAFDSPLAVEARWAAKDVSPMVFEYRGTLLAETLLESAYRCAENRHA